MREYMIRKAALHVDTLSGCFNFHYGQKLTTRLLHVSETDRRTFPFVYYEDKLICAETSDFIKNYTVLADGHEEERAVLIKQIFNILKCDPSQEIQIKTPDVDAKWAKVFKDPICSKYRNRNTKDIWLWDASLLSAPVGDLEQIRLVIK